MNRVILRGSFTQVLSNSKVERSLTMKSETSWGTVKVVKLNWKIGPISARNNR